MENEIHNLIKVWFLVIVSLIFCYYIVSKIPEGIFRLISLLPFIYLFTILPLHFSSFHFGCPSAFLIAWLANFKLLLFSFNKGPLSSDPPKSLLLFISIACLPIKLKQDPSQKPSQSLKNNEIAKDPSSKSSKNLEKSTKEQNRENPSLYFPIKVILLALLISIYKYRFNLNQNVILVLYCFHLYFGVEIVLAICAAPAKVLFGLDLEPQFNEPYLSTSLQDFWGRRWNLMVTSILRSTVYDPVRSISTRILGKTWASVPPMLLVFIVSGLMHELIYYYVTHVDPTWEVTWFFVLQGVSTALEVLLKKALGDRFRLPRWISGPLAIGYVAVTGFWLFFPQLIRNGVDKKAIEEYSIPIEFVRNRFHFIMRSPLISIEW